MRVVATSSLIALGVVAAALLFAPSETSPYSEVHPERRSAMLRVATLFHLARGLPWTRVDLTPAQEETKRAATETYQTQTRIMGRFMRAFVRRNELLSAEPLMETRDAQP